MTARYAIFPKADQDLDDQALYLSSQGGAELGHRFLLAAHETFALMAAQPEIGWPAKFRHPDLSSVRIFRVSGFPRMLALYRAGKDKIEILRVIHGSRNIQALLRREGVL